MGRAGLWSDADLLGAHPAGGGPGAAAAERRPAWFAPTHRRFADRLTGSPAYPCPFGVQAQKRHDNWFAALDGEYGPQEMRELAWSIRTFRDLSRTSRSRQSLIIFVGPPETDRPLSLDPLLEQDHAHVWDILSALSELDPDPWPRDHPQDVRHPDWQWCFVGEPWFVFAASPAHRARRSRNLSDCLTLVFQTMDVFDGLIEHERAWLSTKERIRSQLRQYDAVPPHPHLGDLSKAPEHRWRHALLPDDQSTRNPAACPFRPAAGRP